MTIRNVIKEDSDELKRVVDSSGLFPSEYLDEMISDYFNNPETEEIWLTKIIDQTPIAIAYCAPEKFTEGTYNLYAIGILEEYQGKGNGQEMMLYVEKLLKEAGHRILIVETSGTDDFIATRKFYTKLNYNEEARIRDFWADGDDKIIFRKKL